MQDCEGNTMTKFKIDRNKYAGKTVQNALVRLEPQLYRWLKVMAAVNEATISSALNQSLEYVKKNSERVSL